jgi:hypothetical protein
MKSLTITESEKNRILNMHKSRNFLMEQVNPPQPELKSSSGTDPNLILAKDTLKIISKNTPITDKETEKNIYYVLKVLFGVTPHNTVSLGERMKKYDNRIKDYNLFSYLPSSELIVKLKSIQ